MKRDKIGSSTPRYLAYDALTGRITVNPGDTERLDLMVCLGYWIYHFTVTMMRGDTDVDQQRL